MAKSSDTISVWSEFIQGEATGTLGIVALVIALAMVCLTIIAVKGRGS